MPGQAFAPLPSGGAPVRSARAIPPLPPDIPIVPVKPPWRHKRAAIVLVVLLVLAGLIGRAWVKRAHAREDKASIDAALGAALRERAPKGTRIPVTLSSGPRLLETDEVLVRNAPVPHTCGSANVLDPKTGSKDPSYQKQVATCVAGLFPTGSEAAAKWSAADNARISQTLAPALWMRSHKGTRIPVKLSSGVRLFEIESSVVHYQRGKGPTTCVRFGVIDPKTGDKDSPDTVCFPLLDYKIQ